MAPAAAPAPKPQAPAFSPVVMIDGWMVRQRGVDWGARPGVQALERVAWKEVKSAVVHRLEDHAINDSGRGMPIGRKIAAVPPDTVVVDLGAMIKAEAMRCGLARAEEVFVVADGAVWIWNLIGYRFSRAAKTLDFHHGSQHLRSFARHLYPHGKEETAAWVGPLLHQLRHTPEHRVINTLEKIWPTIPTMRSSAASPTISKTTATTPTMPTWPPATPLLHRRAGRALRLAGWPDADVCDQAPAGVASAWSSDPGSGAPISSWSWARNCRRNRVRRPASAFPARVCVVPSSLSSLANR